jgi:hypothetical protein
MTSCGQTQKKDLLLGSWSFYKFEFNGQLADIPESEKKKANEINRELSISFLKDNKFLSKQRGREDLNNSTGKYLLMADDRLVILGDTSKIIQLDKTFLKLYRNEFTAVIIFKRI